MAETSTEKTATPVLRGPSLLRMIWMYHTQGYDILRLAVQLHKEYGDHVSLPFSIPSYVICDPADLRHLLVANPDNYNKIGALILVKPLMGEGLVTSEGGFHHRHRRVMQPMFHRQKIKTFSEMMLQCTQARIKTWQEGQTVDVAEELMRITLSIISQALFSIDLDHQAHELSDSITLSQKYVVDRVRTLPIPGLMYFRQRQFLRAVAKVDEALLSIIHDRARPDAPPKDDLLGMLLDIRFEDDSRMSEKEIRDEIITLFVAGHETTSNALTWTLDHLSANPEAEAALHQELDTVLGGRLPTLEDIPQLRYVEKVTLESLRLCPPVWLMARFILDDDTLPSGLKVKKGGQILMVNYAAHRNPKYFPDPEKFIPNRFDEKLGPAQGFLPFSTGIRSCVGEPFAKMEMVLILAMICQRFRLKTQPKPKVIPEPLITMRPKHGLAMRIEKRN